MADSSDPLVKLLHSTECRPLLDRLCKRLAGGKLLAGKIRITQLSDQQQSAISALTGSNARGSASGGARKNTHGNSLSVDLTAFAQVVANTGRFDSLRQLVEITHGGEIKNRRTERAARSQAWDEVWRLAEARMSSFSSTGATFAKNIDNLRNLFLELRRSGWLKRVTQSDPETATALIQQAFDTLNLLPTVPTPLAIFAATHTGSAHALDAHQPRSRLLLKMIESFHGDDFCSDAKKATRRRLWESVGLVPDELSSSALVLNLPATGNTLTDTMLQSHRQAGMPCRLTFRHLRLAEPQVVTATATIMPDTISGDTDERHVALYVCENPSVLAAAAEQLGSRCPPMVCVEGHPTLTCWTVLKSLTDAGYQIRYHGDFDWGGIRIANSIYESFGFQPWRFTAADHCITSNAHRKLKPPTAEAVWDPTLAAKIQASGVAIEEESMIDSLLDDLRHVAGPMH